MVKSPRGGGEGGGGEVGGGGGGGYRLDHGLIRMSAEETARR